MYDCFQSCNSIGEILFKYCKVENYLHVSENTGTNLNNLLALNTSFDQGRL